MYNDSESRMNEYTQNTADREDQGSRFYIEDQPAGANRAAHRRNGKRNGHRKNNRHTGMKALAGVLAAGLIAGTAFYGGRVSALSAKSATAAAGEATAGWESIPTSARSASDTTNAGASADSNGSASSFSGSTSNTNGAAGRSTNASSPTASESGSTSAALNLATSSSDTDASDLTVTEVAKKGMSSVVAITNTIQYQKNGYQLFGSGEDSTAEAAASGSGVIVGITDDEVLIVTNHHVIEDASALSVQFVDGTSADASIKGEDTSADLALLAVKTSDLSSDTLNQIAAITFADSDETEVGEQVVAIGNALGYGQSVTTGIISAKDRDLEASDGTTEEGLLQTDAAINPGNSGGALLNMKGELVGINVAKYSSTDVEGMGYSIPSNKVAEVISSLVGKTTRSIVDESERGYLGITTATVTADVASAYNMPQGIYVYSISDGSGAANSDLQEGDIITAFDGQNVSSADDLSDLLKYYKAGETITLTVERKNGNDYEEKTVEVTLGTQPATAQSNAEAQNTAAQRG